MSYHVTQTKKGPKVQIMCLGYQIKKKLASGIGFISLVTFETRTEGEEEEDFKLVSSFELGVVLLPPAAPQQRRAFAKDARVVSSRVIIKTLFDTRTKKRDWQIALFPRR